MKLKRHHTIAIAAYCLIGIALIGFGSWWGYRRYLSPGIEPSVTIYPTRGLDLSSHNGDVDFNEVKRAGYTFVILKASEGVSFIDKTFHKNYTAAREAGLKVGAYHFFRFDCDGSLQANHFLNTVRDMQFDFPLAFDVEESGNPDFSDSRQVIKSLRDAINHLALRGHDPVIYTNKSGYRKFIGSSFADIPLWICSFSDPPGPDRWYMWQFTHRGTVPGVKGHVDINILSPRTSLPGHVTSVPTDTVY